MGLSFALSASCNMFLISKRKSAAVFLISSLALVLAAGCRAPSANRGSESTPGAASLKVPLEFVGGVSCAECHPKETELWRGSHHDLAMQEATPETVLGDFSGVEHEYFGVTSTFFRRGDEFFVRTDGPDGGLVEHRIAYAFGVEPLQQYLIEFPDGRLQALSICWDTRPEAAGGGRWFHLYPDEAVTYEHPLHWTGPQQNWNFMCAECHSTGLEKNYDIADNSYSTTWSEIDVSCEACHGPGSRHVAWARSTAADKPIGDEPVHQEDLELAVTLKDLDGGSWGVDPATLTPSRSVPRSSWTQLETCGRCHSRRVVIDPDYTHGRPLVDTHQPALLEGRLYHADGQILDEVYVYGSFLQSKMHREGVTCGDCHDPHSAELILGDADLTCARCHAPARFDTPEHHFHPVGSPGASCVECHMPSRNYMVVDPRRDHSFRIPRPGLSSEVGAPDACSSDQKRRRGPPKNAKAPGGKKPHGKQGKGKHNKGKRPQRKSDIGPARASGAFDALKDLIK